MEYKFATEGANYADLASGHIFYSLPGHPAFPIRLASEIYQRCLAWRGQLNRPCTIYDPCCGAAYHLSIVAYLHWDSICRVICSDVNDRAVQLAERNLGLLTPGGMARRSREISAMVRLYNKDTHKGALKSIIRMQEQVKVLTAVRPIQVHVFRASATEAANLREGLRDTIVDVVFTDVLHEEHIKGDENLIPDPLWAMLEALSEFLSSESIVAIASDQHKQACHDKYQRLEKFQLGKRQVTILRLQRNMVANLLPGKA